MRVQELLESLDWYDRQTARLKKGPSRQELAAARSAIINEPKKIRLVVSAPNPKNNNILQRIRAHITGFDPTTDVLSVQMGKEGGTQHKYIYKMSFKLSQCMINLHQLGTRQQVEIYFPHPWDKTNTKPLTYSRLDNPTFKANNPQGKIPYAQRRPDPFAKG